MIIDHFESKTESTEPNRSSLISFIETDQPTLHGTNESELDDYLKMYTVPHYWMEVEEIRQHFDPK